MDIPVSLNFHDCIYIIYGCSNHHQVQVAVDKEIVLFSDKVGPELIVINGMKWVAPIKPYKWHYKWITGAITPISGVIWAPITGFWAKNKGESILIIQLPPADSF